ncbi:MAG: PQQ-binding-like beta-propeller repeat protein [Nanoarchaeota archaeon]|nr:PQQ-binding-like beta-propeller repeat protein [Nanoarchaeota archaeon]
MKLHKKRIAVALMLLVVSVILLSLAVSEFSSDSVVLNDWLMFGRTLNGTSYTSATAPINISNGNVVTYTTLGDVNWNPLIYGDFLYVSDNIANGSVYQLNSSNVSHYLDNYTVGNEQEISVQGAVANNSLYFSSSSTEKGVYLYQVNSSNVSQIFYNRSIGGAVDATSGYIIVWNDKTYLSVSDITGGYSTIYQYNATNITHQYDSMNLGGDGAAVPIGFSNPIISNGFLYIGNGSYVSQLNATNVSHYFDVYLTGGNVLELSYSDSMIYAAAANGILYQLNATNVSHYFDNYTTGARIDSKPSIRGDVVFFGSDDNAVYQLNASNVSHYFDNYTTGGDVDSSPAVTDNYVFVGSDDNSMYQLNSTNISFLIGSYATGGDVDSSATVSNGYVFFGSDDDKVYQISGGSTRVPLSSDSQNEGDWLMFGRTLNGTSYTNASGPVNISNGVVVNFSAGGDVDSSLAVSSGFVYVGSDDYQFYQLNASNVSQLILNFSTEGTVDSSPAVANEYVYMWATELSNYYIYQLNSTNVSHKITNVSRIGSFSLADILVWENSLYSSEYEDTPIHRIRQLNASNISQVIASINFDDFGASGSVSISSPSIWNNFIYVINTTILLQLNASNISQENIASFDFGSGNQVFSSSVVSNGYIYIGNTDNKLYQLNASNISQLISTYTTGGNVDSSAAIKGDVLYIGSDDNAIYQLNASNVSHYFDNYTTGGDVDSSPAVTDNYVFVGSDDNNMYQLNVTNISFLIGSYTTGGDVDSSPVVVGGYVYFGSDDDQVYQIGGGTAEGDTTSPMANHSLPGNFTNVSSRTVEFFINSSDDINLKNITLFIWNSSGSLIHRNSTNITGTWNITNWNYTFAYDDLYNWTGLVYDNSDNYNITDERDGLGVWNWTINVTFVDTTPPVINLSTPANPTSTTTTSTNFIFNVTDDSNVVNCSLLIDHAIVAYNASAITKSELNTITRTMAVGSYTWNINCTDASNNIGNSTNYSLTIASSSSSSSSGGGSSGGGSSTSSTSSTSSGGGDDEEEEEGCDYEADCELWSLCQDGEQSRSCIITNTDCSSSSSLENRNCIECSESWVCDDWTECILGGKSRNCFDENSCLILNDKPDEFEDCDTNLSPQDDVSGVDGVKDERESWECDDWSDCDASYDFEDILLEVSSVSGEIRRSCNKGSEQIVQRDSCSLKVGIEMIKKERCGKEFLEFYDVDWGLLGRFSKEGVKMDIEFTDDVGYCAYCYDGIINYDEVEIDCGGSCPECVDYVDKFNWWIYVKWGLWILWLLLLLVLLYLIYSEYRERYISYYRSFHKYVKEYRVRKFIGS